MTRPRRGKRRRQSPNALEARPTTFGPGGRPPLGSTTGQRGCRLAAGQGDVRPLDPPVRRQEESHGIHHFRPSHHVFVRADEIVAIGNNTVRPGKLHDHLITSSN